MHHVNGIPFNVDNDDFDLDQFIEAMEDEVDSHVTMYSEWDDEAPTKRCIAIEEFGVEDKDSEFPWAWSQNTHVDAWSCELY
jgi:hypothetical protein